MPLAYRDNHYNNMAGWGQLGNQLNGIATALPAMRLRQDQMQNQLAIARANQILKELRIKQQNATDVDRSTMYQAQAGLAAAKTGSELDKQGQNQSIADAARQAGQAKVYSGAVSGGLDTQEALGGAVGQLRDAGLVPQGGFDMPRQSIVQALEALGQGRGLQNALSSPSSAATAMTPRTLSAGGVGVNAVGPTGVKGLPSAQASRPIATSPSTILVDPQTHAPVFTNSLPRFAQSAQGKTRDVAPNHVLVDEKNTPIYTNTFQLKSTQDPWEKATMGAVAGIAKTDPDEMTNVFNAMNQFRSQMPSKGQPQSQPQQASQDTEQPRPITPGKFPSRSLATELVNKYGQEAAKAALLHMGYDLSQGANSYTND